MRTSLRLVTSCVLAATASACSDAESPLIPPGRAEQASLSSGSPSGSGRPTEVYERAFIQTIIDRHAVGVRIAESCLDRAVHEELRGLCAEVVAQRSQDIASLRSWLIEWYAIDHEPRTGTRDEKSLERLTSLTGAAFEVELIGVLTDNHERAIKEARHCGDKAGRPVLIAFCEGLVGTTRSEIDQMARWLCAWYGICKPGAGLSGEVAVVLNGFDRSLTFFPADAPDRPETIGLMADGFPVGLSLRGNILAAPLGSSLVLVDAQARVPTGVVELPSGASAGGSAFLDDSVVIVTNSYLNSLSVVNVSRQTLIRVVEPLDFDWPRAVAVHNGRVFVANAMFGGDYWMDGPGTVTVLDAGTLEVIKTVTLSGWNSLRLTVGPDDRIWVLNSGEVPARGTRGSLSVLDPSTLEEVEYHPGFGYHPTELAWGADGLAYVASGAYGLAIWDPKTDTFVRSPEQAVAPDGIPSASAVGFDREGRLYALVARSCEAPGFAYRLSSSYRVEARIEVGVCPSAIEFVGSGS